MQTPTQVTFRDMPVSDAIEARCWKETGRLERYFERIVGCQVTVAESHRRQRQGNLIEIRITLRVPGRELVVSREPTEHHSDEDIEVAIHDAFDRMRRRLQDYARRLREQGMRAEPGVERRLTGEGRTPPGLGSIRARPLDDHVGT